MRSCPKGGYSSLCVTLGVDRVDVVDKVDIAATTGATGGQMAYISGYFGGDGRRYCSNVHHVHLVYPLDGSVAANPNRFAKCCSRSTLTSTL